MKRFKLIYNPEKNLKKFVFTNLNVDRLLPPVTITREKPIEEENILLNTKKKSELVEYEDEEYKKLKNKETRPLVIEDSDNMICLGKLQNVSSIKCSYFTFSQENNEIYITPLGKWYRFTQKISVNEQIDEEDMTSVKQESVKEEELADSDKEEIDYEDYFDDDEGEDFNFKVSAEKKLSKAGKKLRNIVENLEKDEEEENVNAGTLDTEEDGEIKRRKMDVGFTHELIMSYFHTQKISLKELIRKIKKSYSLNDSEKEILKSFISEYCSYEIDKESGERILILNKED